MDYFNYRKNSLYAENVSVNSLVKKYGTPLFIYSKRTMAEHYRKIKNAFKDMDTLVCYSVKANSNHTILKTMKNEGSGFDIVSGGELFRVLKTGVSPKKIVYAGVGKTKEEIKAAVKAGILMFNVESVNELKAINAVGSSMKRKIDVAIRINPDVDAMTHEYTTTGKKENKFGIDIVPAYSLYRKANRYKYINIIGVDMHIGSQITTPIPYINAVNKITGFIKELRESGVEIKYLNIGGGMGIIYNEEKPTTADTFAKAIKPYLKGMGVKVLLEPGRFIMGNAGILAARVIYDKKGIKKNFLIVDAGMNDLIRPSLYRAYHKIIPVSVRKGKIKLYDIVGPICESGDFLGKDRHLPAMKEGDVIAVRSTGAYGAAMASNYNSRPFPAEVLVDGNKRKLIKKRQKIDEVIELETGVK